MNDNIITDSVEALRDRLINARRQLGRSREDPFHATNWKVQVEILELAIKTKEGKGRYVL